MSSHAAATDIPMAHPIIPPKLAEMRFRKIDRTSAISARNFPQCRFTNNNDN